MYMCVRSCVKGNSLCVHVYEMHVIAVLVVVFEGSQHNGVLYNTFLPYQSIRCASQNTETVKIQKGSQTMM